LGLCKRCGTIIKESEVYCEFCKVDLKTLIREKTCRWCKRPFPTHIPNELYCSDEHREEAIKESKRKYKHEYDKKYAKSIEIERLGTDNTTKHPNPNFDRESEIITKLKEETFSTVSNKGRWIDHDGSFGRIEYGETEPCGIQITHNYASFDDYYHTAKHHLLSDRGKCPECGCPDHYKSDKDVACAFCGLILETNPKLMGFTSKDVYDSQVLNMTTQEVAWDKYWKGE
jgi:hypothetical protein